MTAVRDLVPGQVVEHGMRSATYIASCPHPIPAYRSSGLLLVIWRLDNGDVSLDALLPQQDVGQDQAFTAEQLDVQLRAAIRGRRE